MPLRPLIPFWLTAAIGLGGRRRQQQIRLAKLRRSWGREIPRERDLGIIAMYFSSLGTDRKTVNEQTWRDLGMDDLFAKVDRTCSTPGRQVLYSQLRTYLEDDRALAERAREQEVFAADQDLRESCQLLLARLNAPGEQWLASLLLNPFPPAPGFAPLLYLCSFLSVACLAGIAFVHFLILPALLLLLGNAIISATYTRSIAPYFDGFSQIVALLGVSEELAKIPNGQALPQLDYARQASPWVRALRAKLGWLAVDRTTVNDLATSAFGYLNMLFLYDAMVYLRSLAILRQHQAALVGLFEATGSLDAAIAVASYLQSLPRFARPKLVAGRGLEFAGLYHPLLAGAVSNSLHLADRSALIAGPNMAGKTAFIRTVGINLILAQTLNLCLAERGEFPRAIVRSSIRREDDLLAGQSYFFTEIQQIAEFTQLEGDEQLCLFLIDEIFRGTNTIERIASSAAVLRHLGQRQLVLATTHDVELQELLADTFDLYHFSDQMVDGSYRFDYRIQAGPARSRNAIKLLEISGYPSSIIREAEALAARFAEPADVRPTSGEPKS